MPGKLQLKFCVGDKFGKWEVVDSNIVYIGKSKKSGVKCKCACGVEKVVNCSHLKNGKSLGCGKCRSGIKKISVKNDDKYHDWIVIDDTIIYKDGKPFVQCQCKCGVNKQVNYNNLVNNKTRMCRVCSATKHNYHDKRLYRIYYHMMTRCYDVNHNKYYRYGGRNIQVCQSWRCSFDNFLKWSLENGYTDDLEIDRINNDGNYCPENCRWVTHQQNNWNKPGKNKHKGVFQVKGCKRWYARIRIDNINKHLGGFDTAEEASVAYNNSAKEHRGEYMYIDNSENHNDD